MFKNEMEIYQYIGQAMFNALPDEWDSAYFYFRLTSENNSYAYVQGYLWGGHDFDFDVDEIDDEYEDSKCGEAFRALYMLMKKNDSDIPWNKARFELMPDGNFDIQFKFDKDFVWYTSLDVRRARDAELFDKLSDLDVDDMIESWEGLPEDFDRYWLK